MFDAETLFNKGPAAAIAVERAGHIVERELRKFVLSGFGQVDVELVPRHAKDAVTSTAFGRDDFAGPVEGHLRPKASKVLKPRFALKGQTGVLVATPNHAASRNPTTRSSLTGPRFVATALIVRGAWTVLN